VGVAFWVSPILFKLDTFRIAMPLIEYVNPISYIIINSRRVILDGQSPDWYGFMYGLGYSILLLLIGLIILNKLGSKAAEKA
jgi:ABC-2 type transport system permease protein